jgi:uncharacterized Zn finger protein
LTWARIEIALAEQALYSAQLLAGELPHDLERLLQEMGVPLFPTAIRDLAMRCSCPDSAVPCKHLAATFYLLAEAFDADPFQILWWRGRSRPALLDRLRALRAGVPADADPRLQPANQPDISDITASAGTALALVDLPDLPMPTDPDRFWAPPQPAAAPPPTAASEIDLLLRQLPAPAARIGGSALVDRLRTMYERIEGC